MTRIEKVKHGIACDMHQIDQFGVKCDECPYDKDDNGRILGMSECKKALYDDCILLIDDMENTIKLLEEEQ